MLIPLEFYNELRQQIKLSDVIKQKVSLVKKSHAYVGLCPFHLEKTPSFTVNDVKKYYHCFGCGVHGDVIKFLSEITGLSYKESAIKLANDYGIDLPKMTRTQKREYEKSTRIYDILELAANYFVTGLTTEVHKYLMQRGITESVEKQFLIGYTHKKGELIKYFEAKSISVAELIDAGLLGKKEDGKIYEIFTNRIMFPIRNIYNKIVGFGGRVIGDSLPKYINSPETLVFKKGETMYGENIAISASYKKNYAIIVEGYMDVIALNVAGISEAVASLGTSVTQKHIQKLWRSCDEIIICLDGDLAGQRAGNKLINMVLPLIAPDNRLSFIYLPDAKDPDDIIKQGGVDLFNKLLVNKVDLSKAIWRNEYEGKVFSSAESRAKLEQNLTEYCDYIKDKALAVNFRRYFKNQIWQSFSWKNQRKNEADKANKTYLTGKDDQKYTEIEVVESALCSLMVRFPVIFSNPAKKELIADLILSSKELDDFKDWLIDQLETNVDFAESKIEELVKDTKFSENFSLLKDPSKIFLDLDFLNKNEENCELIFDLIIKKHYFLLLKQEYIHLMNSAAQDKEVKASFFIKEIQEVSQELNKLGEFFV